MPFLACLNVLVFLYMAFLLLADIYRKWQYTSRLDSDFNANCGGIYLIDGCVVLQLWWYECSRPHMFWYMILEPYLRVFTSNSDDPYVAVLNRSYHQKKINMK